jgi:hypothetical protein
VTLTACKATLVHVPAAEVPQGHGFLRGERAVTNDGDEAVPRVLPGEHCRCLVTVSLDQVSHVAALLESRCGLFPF